MRQVDHAATAVIELCRGIHRQEVGVSDPKMRHVDLNLFPLRSSDVPFAVSSSRMWVGEHRGCDNASASRRKFLVTTRIAFDAEPEIEASPPVSLVGRECGQELRARDQYRARAEAEDHSSWWRVWVLDLQQVAKDQS